MSAEILFPQRRRIVAAAGDCRRGRFADVRHHPTPDDGAAVRAVAGRSCRRAEDRSPCRICGGEGRRPAGDQRRVPARRRGGGRGVRREPDSGAGCGRQVRQQLHSAVRRFADRFRDAGAGSAGKLSVRIRGREQGAYGCFRRKVRPDRPARRRPAARGRLQNGQTAYPVQRSRIAVFRRYPRTERGRVANAALFADADPFGEVRRAAGALLCQKYAGAGFFAAAAGGEYAGRPFFGVPRGVRRSASARIDRTVRSLEAVRAVQ